MREMGGEDAPTILGLCSWKGGAAVYPGEGKARGQGKPLSPQCWVDGTRPGCSWITSPPLDLYLGPGCPNRDTPSPLSPQAKTRGCRVVWTLASNTQRSRSETLMMPP